MTTNRRAYCEASIVRELQALGPDELRDHVANQCEFFGIPEVRVPALVASIRTGNFIDFDELAWALAEKNLSRKRVRVMRRPRQRSAHDLHHAPLRVVTGDGVTIIQNGEPSEADLDRELAEWKVRHGR